jgi:hypothetical protein
MTPAIQDFPMADYHFYAIGLQYHAAARFAAVSALMPVSGNLFHHALEMILKGKLTHTLSLDRLKKCGHDLRKVWRRFKRMLPTEQLSPFDDLIAKLDQFETLRYPDDLLKRGAQISVGFVAGNLMAATSPAPAEPVYPALRYGGGRADGLPLHDLFDKS